MQIAQVATPNSLIFLPSVGEAIKMAHWGNENHERRAYKLIFDAQVAYFKVAIPGKA